MPNREMVLLCFVCERVGRFGSDARSVSSIHRISFFLLQPYMYIKNPIGKRFRPDSDSFYCPSLYPRPCYALSAPEAGEHRIMDQ